MVVPPPRDMFLLREHAYKDTGLIDYVLPHSSLFHYSFEEESPVSPIQTFIQENTNNIIAFSVAILVFYYYLLIFKNFSVIDCCSYILNLFLRQHLHDNSDIGLQLSSNDVNVHIHDKVSEKLLEIKNKKSMREHQPLPLYSSPSPDDLKRFVSHNKNSSVSSYNYPELIFSPASSSVNPSPHTATQSRFSLNSTNTPKSSSSSSLSSIENDSNDNSTNNSNVNNDSIDFSNFKLINNLFNDKPILNEKLGLAIGFDQKYMHIS